MYSSGPPVKGETGIIENLAPIIRWSFSPLERSIVQYVLGQNYSLDALHTLKVPTFATLSHSTLSMRILENSGMHG